ncbi:DUF362 domain-containing protein [Thermanaerosceptrum fracticalcis]|jgi:uncharacterized protein (DUF362 family)|uniref:DUF362 domain-containing protein n=1 Tax=Thermanaerosceptrum fracticalcis TaxID=1712410 RepID=A0A7G6E7N8_THEFR|nr:DUF362 domain-containing protein [Thermanaerosceptrum fracticalcis]QNB48092.1 DUF362 domain-containing protein [Thermanaerosceptrum fracticalcis]
MSIVAITRGNLYPSREEIHRQVYRAIDLLGGINSFIKKGERVLIKPNVTEDHPADRGTTTDPYIVEALVGLCRQAGAGEIIIGEGAGVGKDSLECMEKTGWFMFTEKGIRLVDLNKEEKVKISIPNGLVFKELKIAKLALEVDAIINVPVLKTHVATLITCCLKNMKGVIPYESKKAMHFHGLHEGIVDLNTVIKPRLNVVDALVAQEGLGPVSGTPLPLGMIMAGADAAAVDTVGAHIMGVEVREVRHLVLAGEKGVGCNQLKEIKVVGEKLEDCVHPFVRPDLKLEFAGFKIISEKGCSGCNMQVMMTLKRMDAAGELDLLRKRYSKVNIIFGQGDLTEEGLSILVGNCQKKNRAKGALFVEGCPPAGWYIRDAIRKELLGLETLVDPGPIDL